MKRVLIITYYWPPTGGSGVQRWVKFAKYLPSEGWQPVIYTPANPEMNSVDESLLKDIPAEAEIVKRRILEPYGIYRALMGKGGGTDVKKLADNPINGQKKSLKSRISLFIRANLFIPDPRVSWVGPSVRFLKKYLREHPVDAIVTTGPPQSMHLIGMKLSKATGLPWLADFRDPWTRIYWFKHLGLSPRAEKKHHKLEKAVFDSATRMISVSPFVRREMQEMTSTKVELITNGFDEDDYARSVEKDGFFNVTHTGLLTADGNPEALWAALGDKCKADPEFAKALRIRLAGKTDGAVLESIKACGLAANLHDAGYQPHDVAVQEQLGASVLILPIRREPESRSILPGKLFEYLAARKPVLGIDDPTGATAEVLRETGAGVVADWDDKEGAAAFLDGCWERFRQGVPDGGGAGIDRYSRRYLTGKLAGLLAEVTEKQN